MSWQPEMPFTTNIGSFETNSKASRLASGRTDSTSKSGKCGWPGLAAFFSRLFVVFFPDGRF